MGCEKRDPGWTALLYFLSGECAVTNLCSYAILRAGIDVFETRRIFG
jgi:hypothetical protein